MRMVGKLGDVIVRACCEISLTRVAANGAASAPQRGCRVGDPAPPGAEAWAVTSVFRRAPGSPPHGITAVGWLGGLFADRTRSSQFRDVTR